MPATEKLIETEYSEIMQKSYIDYAMSVIVARALPDVRDGLKPVQRRILYDMHELGTRYDQPYRKSARIVGDTMGKYHPHGDSSIYDALVHMTEDYSLNAPLADGHGNFGSIDGDGAAAMRYTEARLSKAAMTMLENMEMGLVDFVPNFDDSEKEPVVLPATIPNLLMNGTTGIAVGMATNIPPHNPVEVMDGIIATMDRPGISLQKLMDYIPAPDFPTGGTIVNAADIPAIYETGEGKIKVRAKAVIEKGEYGRKNIVITEIPYTISGNKGKLVENLVNLMRDHVFDEIADVRDESSKEGIRIVIEVKKDRDPENLLNGLYKKTQMEDTYGVNLLAIKDGQPKLFSLKEMIEEFIVFQEELYRKEYSYRLEKAKNRKEVVDGLIKATDVIDLIIEILRGSESVKQAKTCLVEGVTEGIRFKNPESPKLAEKLLFTENQADAILAMPLSRLVGLELKKLLEEGKTLEENIQEFETILSNTKELYKVIKQRLREYRKLFGKERKTELANVESKAYVEEVKIENLYLCIDRFGYVKCLDSSAFERTSPEAREEYPHILQMKNIDRLCIFTNMGNMHQIQVDQIPRCRLRDKGTLIHSLCRMENHEDGLLYLSFEEMFDSMLVFVTKEGFIKKVSGAEFDTTRRMIAATKLLKEDAVIAVKPLSASMILKNEGKVVLITKKKKGLGFSMEEVNEFKKTSRGVKAITLDVGDYVDFATVLAADEKEFEFAGKTIPSSKIRNRKRGVKGQKLKS